MKKYVLSTLVCGVACSAGFADAAPRKTLSDYSTPPSNIIKDAELMINAEYTAIDYDKGDAVPDHLYGFRVDWRRNFAIEQKSFWNAGISLGMRICKERSMKRHCRTGIHYVGLSPGGSHKS